MKKVIILTALLSIAAACTVSEQEKQLAQPVSDGVSVTFQQPVLDEGLETKALDSKFHFYFEDNAQINVYPRSSRECMTYTLASSSSDIRSAEFTVEGFNLKDDDYGAVYPYSRPVSDPSKLTFSLAGQNQNENDDASGISAYDLNYAKAYIRENRGNFAFEHKVTWLRVQIFLTRTETFKTVTVTADEGIANTISLNAVNEDVTAVPTSADEAMVLTLNSGNGIEVEAGKVFIAYVTLPQGVYSNLHIVCGDYDKTVSGKTELAAGRAYPVTMMTKLSKPAASLKAGSVKRGTGVSLSSYEGANIYYTLDGTTPTSASARYNGTEVKITESCTLKAIAIKGGWYDSDVLSVEYTIAKAPKPTVSVTADGEVTITSTMEDAEIYYTIDKSDPNTSSSVLKYDSANKPSVDENTTIMAITDSPIYDGGEVTTYYHLPIDILDADFFANFKNNWGYPTELAFYYAVGSVDENGEYILHDNDQDYLFGTTRYPGEKVLWISIESTAGALYLYSSDILVQGSLWGDFNYEVKEELTILSDGHTRYDFPEGKQFRNWGIRISRYALINIKKVTIGYSDSIKE